MCHSLRAGKTACCTAAYASARGLREMVFSISTAVCKTSGGQAVWSRFMCLYDLVITQVKLDQQ